MNTYNAKYKNCSSGDVLLKGACKEESSIFGGLQSSRRPTHSNTTANTTKESDSLSFAQKCANVLSVISIASTGVALATSGVQLYQMCKTDDKKDAGSGAGSSGGASSMSSKQMNDALDLFDKNPDVNTLKTQVDSAKASISLDEGNLLKLNNDLTPIKADIEKQDAIIKANPDKVKTVNSKYKDDVDAEDASFEQSDKYFDEEISKLESQINANGETH